MKLKKALALILALCMVLSTMGTVTFAAEAGSAVMIGETPYNTLSEALTVAKTMTGDVTIDIYSKVTLNENFAGTYDSIKFAGKGAEAEIYLDVQGYVEASGKTVIFEDLKLSKSESDYVTNAGFMNLAFGVYAVDSVSYNGCTFLNGAYASSGETNFTECIFYRSHDRYGLWAYGNVVCTVDNCTFADFRGIKMYAEGGLKTVELTVKNTDFSAVNNKPAIVLTYGKSVTLENNTYSSTGVFELDLDGAPNGTVVTSDNPKGITCINDNGACGVLVGDKIYTTVAGAAAVAESGDTVILLHDTEESVTFAEGVIVDTNSYNAPNVAVTKPVAKINGTSYTTLDEAIAAANAAGNTTEIVMLQDTDFSAAYITGKVVLDLNGYTITPGTADFAFYLYGGAELTVKDTSAEQDGLIKVAPASGGNAIIMLDATFTLESGNIWSNNNGIYTGDATSVVEISGGGITCNIRTADSRVFYLAGGSVTVNGGTFISDETPGLWNSTLTIYGGKFSHNVSAWCAAGSRVIPAQGMYEVVADTPGPVATIGDDEYASLDDAINAANAVTDDSVSIIKVLKDTFYSKYTITKNVVLDLNGCTIVPSSYYGFYLKDGANFTLKDSSLEGNGKLIVYNIGGLSNANGIYIWNDATFTFESGNIYSDNNGVTVGTPTSVAYLKGGNVICALDFNGSNDSRAVYAYDGKTYISGGTFIADEAVYKFIFSEEVKVSGGSFNKNLAASLLAERATIEKVDDLWVVTTPDPAASIGGTYFDTLADALDTVAPSETVKLHKDDDTTIDTGDKTIYLDPNGYSFGSIKTNGVTVSFDDVAKAALDTQAADKGFAVTAREVSITDSINGAVPSLFVSIDVKTSEGISVFTEATSQENGTATISIPYTKTNDDNVIRVYYVADDGTATEVNATYENGMLTFTTTHFSQYAVVEEISIDYDIHLEAELNPANNAKFYNSGDKIRVNFTISSDEINSLGSFQFNFTYDDRKLELLDIEGLGNADGAFYADKNSCRVSFDVDGAKPALDITNGKVVATAVFEVKDGAMGEATFTIDNTNHPLEVTPQGYGTNAAVPTCNTELVNLSNIIITFVSGDNATFSNGVANVEGRVDYNVPGFVEAGFSIPSDLLVANNGYRMAKDENGEELWMDEDGVVYTTEALKNTAFTEDKTLTAQVVKTHVVTLAAGANGHLEGVVSLVIDDGARLTVADLAQVKVFADPGYEFTEWTPAIDTNITAETTFTANFDHATFAINNTVPATVADVTINGGNSATHGTDVTFTVAPLEDNVTEVGYIIDGIKMPLTEAGGVYTIPGDVIVGDIDIYVQTVDTFLVFFAAGDNGELSGTTTFVVNKGETLSAADLAAVIAEPDAGYKFVGYSHRDRLVTADDILSEEVYGHELIMVLFDHETYALTDVNGNAENVIHGTDYTFVPEMAGKIVTNVTAQYSDGTDCPVVKNNDGSYTIHGDAIVDDITLTAAYVDGAIRFIVNSEYKAIKARRTDNDEKIAVLDTAKLSGEKYVLANGAEFFWSEQYNAYVYIVEGLNENDGVTADMIASSLQVAAGDAREINYDGDITGDGRITAADAQTVTDMLQQQRAGATPMLWRLRADVTGDGYVSTLDVKTVRETAYVS